MTHIDRERETRISPSLFFVESAPLFFSLFSTFFFLSYRPVTIFKVNNINPITHTSNVADLELYFPKALQENRIENKKIYVEQESISVNITTRLKRLANAQTQHAPNSKW